ncbi:thiol reductant ABC exporter subunit CydC [Cellulomonas sp. NPDC089187]|uniref:thiol reductant ABC exporter subunit CydC n=1 Tax=Cellulomonas sp. NPDC089187 TaxID=3154970 RepID=UPI0034489354
MTTPLRSEQPTVDATPGTLTARGRRRDPLWRAVALLDVDRRRFALSALLGTLALGCAVALAAVSAWLITRAAQMPPVLKLSVATVGVRAFGIGRGVFRYLDRLVSHDVALRGMTTLRTTLYTRLATGRPEATLAVRRGDLLARVGADVDAVGDVVVRGLLPATVALALGVGTVVAMSAFLPVAGLILALCLVLAGVVAPWLAQRAAKATEARAADARARMASAALGLLDDAGPLAVQGRTDSELDRLRGADADLADATDAGAGPAAVAAALGNVAVGIAVLGALLTGIPALANGQIAAVELAVIVLTPLAAFEATSVLPAAAIQVHRSRSAAARLMALIDAADELEPGRGSVGGGAVGSGAATPVDGHPAESAAVTSDVPRPVDIPACGPVITARDLAVGWPGRPPVLTGLDLELRPGRALTVVGPSGIGKTTLLLTLAGFLPSRGGDLLLDGVPITDTDAGARLARLSLTTEDAHVFETTVLENLRVARGDATEGEAVQALTSAGLGEWLAGLPDGVETALGSDARSVSGGERRRLLLARALLSPAPLLLIDEPAEHLDPGTADRLVGDLLARATGGDRGVLVVTHRLAPLAAADEVLLLDEGRVAARGTHHHLLETNAQYREAHAAELDEGGNDAWPTN